MSLNDEELFEMRGKAQDYLEAKLGKPEYSTDLGDGVVQKRYDFPETNRAAFFHIRSGKVEKVLLSKIPLGSKRRPIT